MGVDVYTPAYSRMVDSAEYKQLKAEIDAYRALPMAVVLDQSEQEWAEWILLKRRMRQMEQAVGHFRYSFEVFSQLPQINAALNETVRGFTLSHKEVGIHLQEWRTQLLAMFRSGHHEVVWTNAFGEIVANPFQSLVRKYKILCIAFRLGEGLHVA